MTKPALFLDRDGVINVDYGYVHKKENFEFIDGIFELVRYANRLGFLVIIVTNQAGIARGYYTEEIFSKLMLWVKSEFKKNEAEIDAVYYCPHHPSHGHDSYLVKCTCRKPGPGMFLTARDDHKINMKRSIMLGDSTSDIFAAESSGVGHSIYLGNDNVSCAINARDLIEALAIFSVLASQKNDQIKQYEFSKN